MLAQSCRQRLVEPPARRGLVDSRLPLSDREWHEVDMLAMRRVFALKGGRWLFVFGTAWMVLPWLVAAAMVNPTSIATSIAGALLGGLGMFVVMGLVMRVLTIRAFAQRLRAELRVRGHDICMSCGSWRPGLVDRRRECSECGRRWR